MEVLQDEQRFVVGKKLVLLAIPIALSAVVVFWNLTRLGLCHWDEFNYMETAKWFLRRPDGTFTIYEPPGYPLAVAVFFKLFGVKDFVAIAVSGVFAVGTVALVAYTGLRFFGLKVSLIGPFLLLVSPIFITYSRMALTDMAFTFFFSLSLVAIFAAARSHNHNRRGIAFASLALAACAMTKYNGFMPVLVFAFYCIIALRGLKPGERMRAASHLLGLVAVACVPALVLGLLFICFLGVSTMVPQNHVFSIHAITFIIFKAPVILANGLAKFSRAAVAYHSGQLVFFPFISAPYYFQVLAHFVPVPVLVLAIVGLMRKDLRDGPELFIAIWLLCTLFLVVSIPAQYSRAILPALPPLALCGALGVSKIEGVFRLFASVKLPKVSFKLLTPTLLLIVIVFSFQGAWQAVSFEHHGYRDAGQLLTSVGDGAPALAQTQLVFAFYYPSTFGSLNTTTLSKNQYVVVDFIGVENGYEPMIQQLTREGKLKLIETIPADLPPEVYLDTLSFGQLSRWNFTFIQVYRITNATLSPT